MGEAQDEFGCAELDVLERKSVGGLRYSSWRGRMRPRMGIQVEAKITGEDLVTWQRHRGCDVGLCCGNLVKASKVWSRQLEDFLWNE